MWLTTFHLTVRYLTLRMIGLATLLTPLWAIAVFVGGSNRPLVFDVIFYTVMAYFSSVMVALIVSAVYTALLLALDFGAALRTPDALGGMRFVLIPVGVAIAISAFAVALGDTVYPRAVTLLGLVVYSLAVAVPTYTYVPHILDHTSCDKPKHP